MRIIIETSGQEVEFRGQAVSSVAGDVVDGGPPADALVQLIGPASSTPGDAMSSAALASDGGAPASWLVEAIEKAFAEDAGRFDVKSSQIKDGVLDGGSAPNTQ